MMLQEFMASGILGPIHLGLSKGSVQYILGDPQATSDRRKGLELWKYDDLQLAIYQDAVYFIGVYVSGDSIKLPPPLVFDEHILAQIMRLEDMKKFLLANKIAFDVDDKLTFDDQTCLRIAESRVGIYFDEKLRSLQLIEHED